MENERIIFNLSKAAKYIGLFENKEVITNENVKLIYDSEYYYKNRLASLASSNMIERVYEEKIEKLPSSIYEIYYFKKEERFTYIIPMPFVDFSKMKWINFMANDSIHQNVKLEVICNEAYIDLIRKALDERVEVVCVERCE